MLSRNNKIFCNNCGKDTHLYNKCNKPIMSIGTIVFRKVLNKIEFLIICRKDSLGYIEFVRGKYPLHNIEYIKNIIDEMSVHEKHKLLTHSFDELWNGLWGNFNNLNYKNEEKRSRQKYKTLKNGLKLYNKIYKLNNLINNSNSKWMTPEWGFPKGRRNNRENDIQCALREFQEETGYDKNDINIINNIINYEEVFTGSNLKSYKHKYYLGYMDNKQYDDKKFQTSEVSDLKWVTIDNIHNYIRPYNFSRLKIINNINNMLKNNSLIL